MIPWLQIENLKKTFGDVVLFEDISFTVGKDQKAALVAKNGAGKTTLLNIIIGEEGADSGEVVFRNDIDVGYLPQNPELNRRKTVLELLLEASPEHSTAIMNYEKALEKADQKSMDEAIAEMERLQAWDFEARIKQVLDKLKITEWNKSVENFSGGEKKRVALAKVLLHNPDLLILDEPTNHLDLGMIEWLEEYLGASRITLLMVTHDRYFLDRICTNIIELDQNEVYTYSGNYSYFLKKREERLYRQEQEVAKARNLLRTEEEWMRRMPKARGTKAKYRIENYHKLSEVAAQTRRDEELGLQIEASRMGKKIVNLEQVSKSFDAILILNDFSYKFKRFEKVGIVGPNGSGKSTFLNLLTGAISPDVGEIERGETVVFGYYRQEGIQFNNELKIIDVVSEIADVVRLGNGKTLSAKEFLTYFLFPPKMHYQKVEKLSGGEKRRLYLLTVLMRNPNFLILDEPTNDLDIMTLAVLEDYLAQFDGCLVVVSHDRFFMDQIVDHLFVFKGDGAVQDYPGNYTQYREKVKQELATAKNQKKEKESKKPEHKAKEKVKTKLSYKEKLEFEALEKEIANLDKEKTDLESILNGGTADHEKLQEISQRIAEILKLLDEKEDRWLTLSEFE